MPELRQHHLPRGEFLGLSLYSLKFALSVRTPGAGDPELLQGTGRCFHLDPLPEPTAQ